MMATLKRAGAHPPSIAPTEVSPRMLKNVQVVTDTCDMRPEGNAVAVDAELMDLVARLDDDDAVEPLPTPIAALQPIVHLEAEVPIGYEALARFEGEASTEEQFARAAAEGRSVELELACCAAALARVDELPAGSFVSTNVSALCLARPELFQQFRRVDTSRVSIELTQQSPVDDVAILDHHLAALRSIGVRIAIDDVGIGDYRVERIAKTTPAMLKASPRLVSGCDEHPDGAVRLASVVELGRRVGAITVGVGVERPEEAAVLRRLGFDAAQGYLFGKPELPAARSHRAY